jgi:hypothetical protein
MPPVAKMLGMRINPNWKTKECEEDSDVNSYLIPALHAKREVAETVVAPIRPVASTQAMSRRLTFCACDVNREERIET